MSTDKANSNMDSNIFISADAQGRVLMQIHDDVSTKIINLRIALDAIDDLIIELQAAKELAGSLTVFSKRDNGVPKN